MTWIRTCQECGHKQVSKSPLLYTNDKWRELQCRKCHSIALDYGSEQSSRYDDPEEKA